MVRSWESDPKLMTENLQPAGRLRRKSINASLAFSIRPPPYPMLIEPLLSRRKTKCKFSAFIIFVYSGSSSSKTSNLSWGAGGSNVGTNDTEQATSPGNAGLFAQTSWGYFISSLRKKMRISRSGSAQKIVAICFD